MGDLLSSDISSESFAKAEYTAIVSDMHLCEAEPIHPKYPLWKKFKTREFFFDDVFSQFLFHLEEKSQGQPIELILNGDIFDFDSVTSIPPEPIFTVSRLEQKRGLHPRPAKSRYKISVILKDHLVFIEALRSFVLRGHRVVFVLGNHDLELHFPEVQQEIRTFLNLSDQFQKRVRFVDWFYISNGDTLVEHGNQYDPYCVCEDPINPYVRGYNFTYLKLPFGNLACRYIMNGMGFFNPHVDTNYIMTLKEYVRFFLKYVVRAQPGLMLTWLGGSFVTLAHSFLDRLAVPIRNPLRIEDRIQSIAEKANASPRMVRELKELFAAPAASNPFMLARELWLDRASIVLFIFILIFQLMVVLKATTNISLFWAFIPLFILLPFFVFYSKSISSLVSSFKEPDDRILAMASAITGAKRIVFGHTHHARHEIIGAVEHLNSGCWSPAFLDVECTRPIDQKTFVWISPGDHGDRQAELLKFSERGSTPLSRQNAPH